MDGPVGVSGETGWCVVLATWGSCTPGLGAGLGLRTLICAVSAGTAAPPHLDFLWLPTNQERKGRLV